MQPSTSGQGEGTDGRADAQQSSILAQPGASLLKNASGRSLNQKRETVTTVGEPTRTRLRHRMSTSTGSAGQNEDKRARVPHTGSRVSVVTDPNDSVATDVAFASTASVRTGAPASSSGAASKVVTSFRGMPLPEYKGQMPRVGHTAVVYGKNLYVYGGVNAKGQYNGHMFCHEARSLQWEEVRGPGAVPSGRAGHAAVLVDDRMYVYGGHRNLEVFDDLICFTFGAMKWERISYEKSQGPGPLFFHTAVYAAPTHSMIVLGGFHQREQNTYIGHSFDLERHVWVGIPPPSGVNAQHLQLLTAAFHAPKSAVVVLGMTDEDEERWLASCANVAADSASQSPQLSAASPPPPPPSVYLMNVHSFAWTKVVTTRSPESPIPFQMDAIWAAFMREFLMMGGLYDEAQGRWYFPLNLSEVQHALLFRGGDGRGAGAMAGLRGSTSERSGSASGSGRSATPRQATRRPNYGFLILQLSDVSWSIAAISFPTKLLVQLATRNRERAGQLAIDAAAAAAGRAPRHSSNSKRAAVPSHQSAAATTGGGEVRALGRQLMMMSHSSVSMSMPWGSAVLDGDGKEVASDANDETSGGEGGPTADRLRKLLLFSVKGAPQFQHKYAYAAFRDSSGPGTGSTTSASGGRNSISGNSNSHDAGGLGARGGMSSKKVRPLRSLVMHGGTLPGEDYTMLMFTPVTTRADAFAAQRLHDSFTAASLDGAKATGGTSKTASSGKNARQKNQSTGHLSVDMLRAKTGDGEDLVQLADDSNQTSFTTDAASPFAELLGDPLDVEADGDAASVSSLHTGYEPSGRHSFVSGIGGDDDEVAEDTADATRESCLLPTLASTRSTVNAKRFALLFHPTNSVRDHDLLPYANCPVAVLENERDVQRWSVNYYQDTRRWLADKLKTAVAEDRQIRRAVKKQQRHDQRQRRRLLSRDAGKAADSAGKVGADGLVHSDDSADGDDDGGWSSSSASASDTADNLPRRRSRRGTSGTDAASLLSSSNLVRHGTIDRSVSTVGASNTDLIGEGSRQQRDFFDRKGLAPFTYEQIVSATAPGKRSSVNHSGMSPPDGSMANGSTGPNWSLTPGLERLRLTTKRHEEQQRLPNAVFERADGAANTTGDLGSAVAYVLMHNAIDALPPDLTVEVRSSRARLRWRFLRALVRTGEAAFILYRVSQEASKMRALKVTSTPGLLLAPELHLIGPVRAYKVPSRPVPYTLPRTMNQASAYTEVTPSGMVVYHNIKHVK